MHNRSAWLASAAIGACLLLAACGGSDEPAPSFAAPDYSYLPKLRLNVGTLTVEDHAAQSGGQNDLGPTAPTPPDQALQQMAHDRLVAAGNSSTAIFTIDQASITNVGGGALDGRLAVHLDILTANGGHAGYAEAHVSRQFVPGAATADDGTRAQLYNLTQQMMQDMNVELEYQVQRSLRDWLVDASGAPVAGSVDQQALPPPGSAPGTTMPNGPSSVGTTPVGATPMGASESAGGPGPTPLAPPQAPGSVPSYGGPTALAPEPAPGQVMPGQVVPSQVAPSQVAPDQATPGPVMSPPPSYLQPPAGAAADSPPGASGY